jgi:hypothetical protein
LPGATPGNANDHRRATARINHHEESNMGFGTSIFLIAVGAIMRFAVTTHTTGFSIHTAGMILMIVGVVGLLISAFYAIAWAGRSRGTVTRETVVRDPRDTRTY